MISTLSFAAGSVLIIWLSRRSLPHPASHGFSRLFAFEAILALVVLNAPYWFVHPLRAQQLAPWLLLIASVVLVVWGITLLRRFGKSRPATDGAPVFEWENTERLATSGVYRYVRHPMYSSLLFLAWGTFLKSVSMTTLALALIG